MSAPGRRRDERPGHRTLVALAAVQLKALGIVLLAVALMIGVMPFAQLGAEAAAPRVVIIVGPVGQYTDHYRADGRAAAAAARRYSDDVVTMFSPHATWPAVRRALSGASIVVYLGHGNGWPSRYSRSLNPRTQDGLGLNPVGGADDVAHQYFGEWHLANKVQLAPGALVILSHLCYASGNSEPGLPEGTLDVAQQRVDNYAAGWLAAGAGAVLVDAYQQPAHYVEAALARSRPIERIWRAAPSFHDHVLSFPSQRSPGAVAYLDPERRSSGFTRSLVVAAGGGQQIPAGPGRNPQVAADGWEIVAPSGPTPAPDAFALGARPGAPELTGMPLAGATADLVLPVEVPEDVKLGSAYRLGMRWVPLDVPSTPVEASTSASSSLVAPESAASLVEVVEATSRAAAVTAPARLPPSSGRYRLEVTVHDGDGVALPYAIQASIPPVIVHVGGAGSAWLEAPARLTVAAGTAASVQVLVVNGEADPWGACAAPSERMGPDADGACAAVRLAGRWLPVGDGEPAAPMTMSLAVPAGSAAESWLAGPVPAIPGTYILVASVERSTRSSPVEILGRPATITVEVVAAPLVPSSDG